MKIIPFIEQLSLNGCWPNDPALYITLIQTIPERQRNITELAAACGVPKYYLYPMVKNLSDKGFVKRVFGGSSRYVILTEKGEELLRGLSE